MLAVIAGVATYQIGGSYGERLRDEPGAGQKLSVETGKIGGDRLDARPCRTALAGLRQERLVIVDESPAPAIARLAEGSERRARPTAEIDDVFKPLEEGEICALALGYEVFGATEKVYELKAGR